MNIQSVGSSLSMPPGTETSAVARAATPATPPPASERREAVSQEALEAAMRSVQDYIQPFNSNLQFSVNNDTRQVVVRVIDSETKELIRQIPSEEMVAIAKALDSIKGLLVKQSA